VKARSEGIGMVVGDFSTSVGKNHIKVYLVQ
jgi:hypothetical protein